jgi:hypothetical protein
MEGREAVVGMRRKGGLDPGELLADRLFRLEFRLVQLEGGLLARLEIRAGVVCKGEKGQSQK